MKRRFFYIKHLWIILNLLALLLVSCGPSPAPGGDGSDRDAAEGAERAADSGKADRSELSVNFIKCGKADMIILKSASCVMVIDTGEEDDGGKLTDFLEGSGIDLVDILVITHFDRDHVGGAPYLLDKMPVKKIYIPDYEGTSKAYERFADKLKEIGAEDGKSGAGADCQLIRLRETVICEPGDIRITLDPPSSYQIPDTDEEYDNDFSLITAVEHGKNTMLFTGDAEDARISDYLGKRTIDRCDLIKMPHHGRYHDGLEDLIAELKPKYAVITDSEKNPAEKKTLKLLAEYEVTVFSTAEGSVEAISDGETVRITG